MFVMFRGCELVVLGLELEAVAIGEALLVIMFCSFPFPLCQKPITPHLQRQRAVNSAHHTTIKKH